MFEDYKCDMCGAGINIVRVRGIQKFCESCYENHIEFHKDGVTGKPIGPYNYMLKEPGGSGRALIFVIGIPLLLLWYYILS